MAKKKQKLSNEEITVLYKDINEELNKLLIKLDGVEGYEAVMDDYGERYLNPAAEDEDEEENEDDEDKEEKVPFNKELGFLQCLKNYLERVENGDTYSAISNENQYYNSTC